MLEITEEQQLKINKLMTLKYKWHCKMMAWTWLFIAFYSVLVFFLLVHFHQVEYYVNWNIVILLSIVLWICFLVSLVWDTCGDLTSKNIDKSMASIGVIAVVVGVIICSMLWLFYYEKAPIEDVFFIFVIFVGLYFLLCFIGKKTVTRNILLFIYLVFYFAFLYPVLLQAISNLWIFWKLWNLLFWVSPLFLVVFRTYLVDFIGSWFFIRKFFLKKDSEIWNCPQCHYHILKNPVLFCPHCGNPKYSSKSLNNDFYCNCCWFKFKIRDFDFPNYCPHCGLSFRKRKARK